jgi:hypothetical protein
MVTVPESAAVPIPLSKLADVARSELQLKATSPPCSIVLGVPESTHDGAPGCGGGGSTTFNFSVQVTVPPAPVNVPTKVVVSSGETVAEPLAATVPIPGVIVRVVAFEEFHESVVDSPRVILSLASVSVQVGFLGASGDETTGSVTVTVVSHVMRPPTPANVPV